MAKTIKTLGENPSKQEEIDFFSNVMRSVPEGSYLNSLFTVDFGQFVVTKIRDDIRPDIYTEWQAEAQAANSLNSNFIRMSDEVKRLKEERAVFLQSADAMRKQIADQNADCVSLRETTHDMICERDSVMAELEFQKKCRADDAALRAQYASEIAIMRKMLIAVVNNTSDEDAKTTARMLVYEWER